VTPENSKRPRGKLFALVLIIAGAFLFLDNLGIVPIEHIGAYWPLALVVFGAGLMIERRSAPVIIWGSTLIAAGILLILGNLDMVRVTSGAIWSLLLIAAGVMLLVRPAAFRPFILRHREFRARRGLPPFQGFRHRHEFHGPERWSNERWSNAATDFTGNKLKEVAIFFGVKRRVQSQDFQGGELVSVFGSIELDLSEALIAAPERLEDGRRVPRGAVLEASAVFGAIDIIVPRTWRVITEGAGVFGAYEDKTVPPRPEPGLDLPTLILRGGAVFGAVTLRNESAT
jgi:Domain of unknown function (DUF5668)